MTSSHPSVNPHTGKLLERFEHLTSAQLEKSLAAAESCFQTWKHTSYAERAVIVNKAAALMHAHVDDFAKLLIGGKRIDRPPVVSFYRVKDEAAAIAPANDSDFGLGGSVWTKDGARGTRQAGREPDRHRHDVRQQHRLVRCRASLRRHQELGLRTRAGQPGHPGVRQQEAGPHRSLRGTRLSLEAIP
jgi:hypothetical protein